jgi:hypothetical protein
VLALHNPEQPDMQITSLMDLEESAFRKWPSILEARSNIRGEILDPGDRGYDSPD